MSYDDLRGFLAALERRGDLRRITEPVDPVLEITEVCRRILRDGGPALLFENPKGFRTPVLGNLFGTPDRVAAAIGRQSPGELRQLGEALAALRQPAWPGEFREVLEMFPAFGKLLHATPRVVKDAPCRENIIDGADVDLSTLPVQVCWPGDAGPLIGWGLVITKGPRQARQNVGVYRQQVLGRNKLILRWMPQRGGAADYRDWCALRPGERFPVAVALGADPAMLIAAVCPVPDAMSEFQFAGLLRGARTAVCDCQAVPLQVPATAEFVFEGHIEPGEEAPEGPFGDHTGYYHGGESFPVLTVERITHRNRPIYHTTYAGRPPFDEASVLGAALNELFIPILQKQFPEVVDFYLPPEACSYRLAAVSIRKQFPGHARRVMFGIWSQLPQFTYTKIIIVTDDDINVRDWQDLLWAVSTRVDPARDMSIVEHTPVDSLDFASPVSGLGSKLGVDATGKWPGETGRQWGVPIAMSDEVIRRIDSVWDRLNSAPARSAPGR